MTANHISKLYIFLVSTIAFLTFTSDSNYFDLTEDDLEIIRYIL